MRIRGGGVGRVLDVPRKQRERRPAAPVNQYYRDVFEVTPVRAVSATAELVRDLAEQGRARVEEDEGRAPEQLRELGRLMGALTAELVVELINHFVQRPRAQRASAMVVLTSALFVEFWALASSQDPESVLERFVTFIEETEGQPTRRLAGTLYATR